MLKPAAPKRRKIRAAAVETLENRVLLTRLVGIDVSYYQGTAQGAGVHINWTSVKSSKQFAYIRATYGNSSDDADIDYNATNALAAGMYVGFYHYAYYSLAGHPATTEADNYFDKVKPYLLADGKHLMPVLDVEEGSTVADGGTLSSWVNAWCNRVSSRAQNELGLTVTPMVYVSASPAGSYFDSTIPQSRPLWVAVYPSTTPNVQTGQPSTSAGGNFNGIWQDGTSPTYYQSWAFWQYTSSGSVSGISGNVDLDVFQGDTAALQSYVIGSPGRFANGTHIKTPYSINIWDTGNANGSVLGTTTPGATGTILEGPVYGNSFMRWHVDFDSGPDGWVAEYQTPDKTTLAPIEWLSGPVVTNISSTAANGAYKAGQVIPITVAFNDTTTVTGTPRITLDLGGTSVNVNYSSGSGTSTLTFNYTVAAGQNDTDLDYSSLDALAFNNGTIKDSLGNFYTLTLPSPGAAGSLGANKNIVIDTTAPTITGVTSTLANGSYTAGTVVPIRITFSENVTVTGTPTLALNAGGGASASYASGSGTNVLTFNYTVAAGQSTVDLDYSSTGALALNGGTIRDAATNNATLTLPAPGAAGSLGANKAIVIDTAAPTITNVTSTAANGAYKAGTIIPVTVTFSEVVTVTGTPQITLNSGAVVNYSSGGGTSTLTFNYTVGAGENVSDLDYASTSALALNGGAIRDLATNNATLTLAAPGASGSLGFNKNIVVDTTTPTVTDVTSTTADGLYGAGAVIAITITFSEPVNVTGIPPLALSDGGTASYVSGTGSSTLTFNYTVGAGQNSADLDYASASALSLNSGTIRDPASNNASLTLVALGDPGSLGANKEIVIDGTAPGVTNVTSPTADGLHTAGGLITIEVTFSEAVTVTGTPLLALNSGGSASYASGSGSTTLTFAYTVGAGDNSADLDYASASALTLNGGTIKDAANNNAALSLPAPGSAGSLGANKDIVVDALPPSVSNVTSTTSDGLYGGGATIDISVVFSEPVTVTGTPLLALNSGGTASYVSGSGTNTLTFSYTVATNENSSDLDYISASSLTLNGGTIQDAAVNPANLTLAAPGTAGSLGANKNIAIDTNAPAANFGGQTPAVGSSTLDFTVTYTDGPAGVDIATLDGNDITVTGPGGFTANATFISVDVASNGSPRVATYRIAAPGGSWNVADNGLYTVTLNAGQVSDAAVPAHVAAGGMLGTFNANLPFAYVLGTTLHVEYAPAAPNGVFSTDGSNNLTVIENATTLPFAPGSFSDIVIHGSAGDDAVLIATAIAEPITFDGQTGSDSITIDNGGSHTFASDAAAMTASLSITVNPGGSATFSADQHLAALTVNGSATLTGGPGKVLVTKSFAAGGSGALDLTDNSLVVDYDPPNSPLGSWDGSAYTAIRGLVQSGYHDNAWDGPGIRTSLGDTLHNLATDEASNVLGPAGGMYFGESIDGSAVIVKYTYGGDANLDGKLNIDDYTRIDSGVASGTNAWTNGDFNHDGKVNIDDYVILDGNLGLQGPAL